MAVIDWKLTDLIPTSGLLAWHLYDPATSASNNINDASGNGKHLTGGGGSPVLTLNVMGGHPGWFFDGSSTPLATSSSAVVNAQHVFVLASATGTAFNLNRGLLSGKTSGDWLTSENAGTQFFQFGADYTYRKSDTAYADDSMEAPLNEEPELLEMTQIVTGVNMDGIQVGQQRDLDGGARKWKGYFFEQMIYNRQLTSTERRQVMLYFNIKYGTWSKGVPLFFPSKDLLTQTEILNNRFDDLEPDYEQITDKWTYEDGRPDFNEIAATAPFGWDYEYVIPEVPGNIAQAYAYREIFEAFNRQARLINPFYFTDKWGQTWSDVRIEEYRSSHEAHRSWVHEIRFRLMASTASVVVGEVAQGVPESILFEGDEITFNP